MYSPLGVGVKKNRRKSFATLQILTESYYGITLFAKQRGKGGEFVRYRGLARLARVPLWLAAQPKSLQSAFGVCCGSFLFLSLSKSSF